MSCIVGLKKSALTIANTTVDNSITSIGVRIWLPSSSLKIAETVNVAIPCARKAGPSLNPLMMSHTAYPEEDCDKLAMQNGMR